MCRWRRRGMIRLASIGVTTPNSHVHISPHCGLSILLVIQHFCVEVSCQTDDCGCVISIKSAYHNLQTSTFHNEPTSMRAIPTAPPPATASIHAICGGGRHETPKLGDDRLTSMQKPTTTFLLPKSTVRLARRDATRNAPVPHFLPTVATSNELQRPSLQRPAHLPALLSSHRCSLDCSLLALSSS